MKSVWMLDNKPYSTKDLALLAKRNSGSRNQPEMVQLDEMPEVALKIILASNIKQNVKLEFVCHHDLSSTDYLEEGIKLADYFYSNIVALQYQGLKQRMLEDNEKC